MPLRSVEAASRDDAIAAAREQFGPTARVVGVRRVRSGGVLGFFATERFVAEVEPGPATPGGLRLGSLPPSSSLPSSTSTSTSTSTRGAAEVVAAVADGARRPEVEELDPISELAGLLGHDSPGPSAGTYSRASAVRTSVPEPRTGRGRPPGDPQPRPYDGGDPRYGRSASTRSSGSGLAAAAAGHSVDRHPGDRHPGDRHSLDRHAHDRHPADRPPAGAGVFDAALFDAARLEAARIRANRPEAGQPAPERAEFPRPKPARPQLLADPVPFQPARVPVQQADSVAAGPAWLRAAAVQAAPAPWSVPTAPAEQSGQHTDEGTDDRVDERSGPSTGESPSPSPFTAALARMVSGDRDVRQAVQQALDNRAAERADRDRAADDPKNDDRAKPVAPQADATAATSVHFGARHQEEEPVADQDLMSPFVHEARPAELPAWAAAEPQRAPAPVSSREEAIAEALRSALAQGRSAEALADLLRKVLAGASPQAALAAEPLQPPAAEAVPVPVQVPVPLIAQEPVPEPAREPEVEPVTETRWSAGAAEPLWGEPVGHGLWGTSAPWPTEIVAEPTVDVSSAEPVVAPEPVSLEPVAPEPVAVEPVALEPVALEPVADPEPVVAVEPVTLEPVVALEPVILEPVALEPVALEPVTVPPLLAAGPLTPESVATPRTAQPVELAEPAELAQPRTAQFAAVLARTASDPAPLPADATTVMPPLSLLPPLPTSARRGAGRPPVPSRMSRPPVPPSSQPAAAAAAPLLLDAEEAPAPVTVLATVTRLPIAQPAEPAEPRELPVAEAAVDETPDSVLPAGRPATESVPPADLATDVTADVTADVVTDTVVPATRTVNPAPAPRTQPSVRPRPGDLIGRLRALGLPEFVLGPTFVADAEVSGTYAALTRALSVGLPRPPQVPEGAGEVLFVVGPGVETLRAARALAASLRLEPDRVQWATRGDLAGLAPKGSRMTTIDTAIDRRQDALVAGTLTIVAVDAPLRADAYWMAQMLAIWTPVAVWAVVDATRKPEDVEPWVDALPRVDALMVQDSDLSADPAAVLQRIAVPVALVDGVPATAHRWASVLCERLEKHRS